MGIGDQGRWGRDATRDGGAGSSGAGASSGAGTSSDRGAASDGTGDPANAIGATSKATHTIISRHAVTRPPNRRPTLAAPGPLRSPYTTGVLALLLTLLSVVAPALAGADGHPTAAEAAADAGRLQRWLPSQRVPDPHPELARRYRFSGQVFAEVAKAQRARPGLVRIEHYGRSRRKVPLWAVHIADPNAPVTRKVLVVAGLHALEWVGTELAVDLIRWYTRHPEPGVQLTVVPLANPDGRTKSEKDLLAGRNAYRRGNAKNIDLNRDWAVHRTSRNVFRHVIPAYYRVSPGPLSQPETAALDALLDRERFHRAVSVHSFGAAVFYPWSGRAVAPPDAREFRTLGRAMVRAQGNGGYGLRQLGRWAFFFRALGSEIDHWYGRYGIRAFLLELTRSGVQLGRPKTWSTYFRWYNPVDPSPALRRGHAAVRTLILHDALPSEVRARSAGDGDPIPPVLPAP